MCAELELELAFALALALELELVLALAPELGLALEVLLSFLSEVALNHRVFDVLLLSFVAFVSSCGVPGRTCLKRHRLPRGQPPFAYCRQIECEDEDMSVRQFMYPQLFVTRYIVSFSRTRKEWNFALKTLLYDKITM